MSVKAHFFDPLVRRYDLLNRILSLGLDGWWRGKVAEKFPDGICEQWLDLAVGTGDQVLRCIRKGVRARTVVGVDESEEMLRAAAHKLKTKNELSVDLVAADAGSVPFAEARFDVVTCSFGVRNFPDLGRCLRETFRVLKPNGRLIVLELSVPTNPLIRPFYRAYSRWIIPFWGGLIAGQLDAYRYLARSIEQFPKPEQFCEIMLSSGFSVVTRRTLFPGVCTLYVARKGNIDG